MLADTVDQVDRNYVKEVDRRELIEAAIKGVLSRLDPYSAYIGPEELASFRTSVESEFGGIGIHVSTEDGDLRVLSPIYGTPRLPGRHPRRRPDRRDRRQDHRRHLPRRSRRADEGHGGHPGHADRRPRRQRPSGKASRSPGR